MEKENTSALNFHHTSFPQVWLCYFRGILFLWIQALTTVVYLINRLHSSALNSESPYFTLHETLPYYSSPQVFGSKSFPYT